MKPRVPVLIAVFYRLYTGATLAEYAAPKLMEVFSVGAFLMTTGCCQNSFLYDEAHFPVCVWRPSAHQLVSSMKPGEKLARLVKCIPTGALSFEAGVVAWNTPNGNSHAFNRHALMCKYTHVHIHSLVFFHVHIHLLSLQTHTLAFKHTHIHTHEAYQGKTII